VKKLLKISALVILIVLISILVILISFKVKYSNWELEFEGNINVENLVNRDDLSDTYTQKATKFVLSSEDTEFLELQPVEIGNIFFNILDQYSNQYLTLESIYIIPNRTVWNVCAKIDIDKISLDPWVCLDLNKDNIQSAQIYTTKLEVGPYEIRNSELIQKINSGIANSLVTVNENGFSGRYLENIEILEESVVIKGSRY
jgi:hypothetical protein